MNRTGRLAAEFMLGVEPRRTTYSPWFPLNCAQLPPDPRNLMRPMCEGRTGEITGWRPPGADPACCSTSTATAISLL
mgnify:CR=1 FL=1